MTQTGCRASLHWVIKIRGWGAAVLPWEACPALNGALRMPQSGGGFQVQALPRSGWAAAGILLFTSAACAVGDPSSNVAPAIPSSFPTVVVQAAPTKPEAGVLPTPEAGVPPSPEMPQPAVRPPAPKKEKAAVPRPDHIVVVILENKHRSSVIRQASYLNKLAAKGANMTHSYGVTHPSQPNY